MEFRQIYEQLLERQDLTYDQAKEVMNNIMNGEYTNVQISGLLTALRMKGETPTEIAGLAQSMQDLTFPIEAAPDAIDVVGTGGAEFKTFNVSSMASLVLASMGIKVAKHGNRSNTSKCGSADFLEALGLNLRIDPKTAYKLLQNYNFVYLFAPFYHRSMKHAIIARKELQTRTVFNILGPLTNPMKTRYQLLGVFDPKLQTTIAESLLHRDVSRAAVVYNERGADEILNNGVTSVVELRNQKVERYDVEVADFGLSELDINELRNRSVHESCYEALKILNGERTPLAEFTAINAAMALKIAGQGEDLEDNTERVLNHIQEDRLLSHIKALIYQSGGELTAIAPTITE